MKKTIGILAHVDAGKTTFSEQALFLCGALRAPGRVDHKDAFLDAHPIERRRGITIFSDQATFKADGDTYYWLDTPGHADFSPEMERAIAAMDYAIVLVSCAEGVQSHTENVWRLLKKHAVPAFLFVNKIDRAGADFDRVLNEIMTRISADAADARDYAPGNMPDILQEAVAERDDGMLEMHLSGRYDAAIFDETLARLIGARELFPVFSGAALTGAGVAEFLRAVFFLTRTDYARMVSAPFSARVYKIRHDAQRARICFFKVLSGSLSVRDDIGGSRVSELRIYQGAKYTSVRSVSAGDLCAAVGLNEAKVGDVLGAGADEDGGFSSEPMLRSTVIFPKELRSDDVLRALKEMEAEDPSLSVEVDSAGISLSVMGEIQLEVLTEIMRERYNMNLTFGARRVIYMETISAPAVGVGHYEPLRHYAEVHLRLLPAPRGNGVSFESLCHVDTLSLNWQRLIETHVFEKRHRGVLIGARLTDVRVQLLSGRAHLKHTEGGDFREATYRAIRNALMFAQSVLLEPICLFTLRAPADMYGRIAGDLNRMRAECRPPAYSGDVFDMEGEVSFREISAYGADFTALTHGRGALSYRLSRYAPARDADAIIAEASYNPRADDSPDSMFCAKGAGFLVAWDKVADFAHLPKERDI